MFFLYFLSVDTLFFILSSHSMSISRWKENSGWKSLLKAFPFRGKYRDTFTMFHHRSQSLRNVEQSKTGSNCLHVALVLFRYTRFSNLSYFLSLSLSLSLTLSLSSFHVFLLTACSTHQFHQRSHSSIMKNHLLHSLSLARSLIQFSLTREHSFSVSPNCHLNIEQHSPHIRKYIKLDEWKKQFFRILFEKSCNLFIAFLKSLHTPR